MLSDPTPVRSARATAALNTRCLLRGIRGSAFGSVFVVISRPPAWERPFGVTSRVDNSPFVSQKLSALVSTENAKDLLVLKELIEAGEVTPVIEKACIR
jgi:hypothetical protein